MAIAVDGDYEVLTGGNLISGAVLLMVSGFITVVVAMVGFCGAAGMWRPLLVIVSSHTITVSSQHKRVRMQERLAHVLTELYY